MPVERYRTIEDMAPPWRDPADPRNLRLVAEMLEFYRKLNPPSWTGVRRFRSIEEANDDRDDPYRRSGSLGCTPKPGQQSNARTG
jgi:hypothetical protein